MNLVKSLSHFWNVTLGVDCPDESETATSYGPETEELKASLERVEKLEQNLSSTSNKAGKGGKSNKLDIPTATIDTKAAVKAAQEKPSKEQDNEIEK